MWKGVFVKLVQHKSSQTYMTCRLQRLCECTIALLACMAQTRLYCSAEHSGWLWQGLPMLCCINAVGSAWHHMKHECRCDAYGLCDANEVHNM